MPKLDRRRSNPEPANVIGSRVRDTRQLRAMSQTECALALHIELQKQFPSLNIVIDQSDMSRLESGKRPVWDYELKALAIVLAVSSDYLLGLVDDLGALALEPEDSD